MKRDEVMAMTKAQLEAEIEKLKKELEQSKQETSYYQDLANSQAQKIEGISAARPHNERGAGRKAKISALDILMAKDYRSAGRTYTEIATMTGLAVGTVYKMLNPDKAKRTPPTSPSSPSVATTDETSTQTGEQLDGQISFFES
jgi:hypothetical protein